MAVGAILTEVLKGRKFVIPARAGCTVPPSRWDCETQKGTKCREDTSIHIVSLMTSPNHLSI